LWYVPSASRLAEFARLNTAGGVFEGDPDRLSLAAVIFNVRALEGYQLFLPLFVAFICRSIHASNTLQREMAADFFYGSAEDGSDYLLFQNKDPRYSAPLLAAIAIITASAFRNAKVWTGVLLAFLVFQHYLVSFGIRSLPQSVVLMKGAEGQLSWHWNLYTQEYFGLWGAPARENWKIEHVLNTVGRGRLGLVPDIPRFDSQHFLFYIELLKVPIQLNRVAVFRSGCNSSQRLSADPRRQATNTRHRSYRIRASLNTSSNSRPRFKWPTSSLSRMAKSSGLYKVL
jgi:hypothetical protein